MNKKIALFTDLHIGAHQNNEKWLSIAISWSKWFKKSCIENNIDEIIFCGDFFDDRHELNNYSINIGKTIIEYLRSNFKLHLLVGNHDCYHKENTTINSLNIFKGLPNVEVYSETTQVKIGDKIFVFVPWGADIKKIPNGDVIIGHFEINNFKMNGSQICDNGISSTDLYKKAPLIFSGHFHAPQEKEYKNSNKIVYVGSPYQLTFGEREDNKQYIVYLTQNHSYFSVYNKISPKHHILNASDLKRDFARFSDIIKNNIIRLNFDDNLSNDEKEKIILQIQNLHPLIFENEFNNAQQIIAGDVVNVDNVDIEDVFVSFIKTLNFTKQQELITYILEKYNLCKK